MVCNPFGDRLGMVEPFRKYLYAFCMHFRNHLGALSKLIGKPYTIFGGLMQALWKFPLKFKHYLSPTCLSSIFRTTSSVHSHNLRNSKYNLFVPRPSTEAGKRSFQYRGSVLWYSLPSSAKTQPTLSSFKSCI